MAAGLSDGLGLGDNFKSYLISQGLEEILEFGAGLGLPKEEVLQINSVSDLLVTAYSTHSRNYRFGFLRGNKLSKIEILKQIEMEVEGLSALETVKYLSEVHKFQLPLMSLIFKIVHEEHDPSLILSILKK